MTTDIREHIDQSKIPNDARVVLDYLARQPARLFRFDDLAKAVNMTRGRIEGALRDLRNPRYGSPLQNADANGSPLRARWAWLPPDSPIRDAYDPLPAPAHEEMVQPHATHTAHGKKVSAVRAANVEALEAQRAITRAERKKLRQAAAIARLDVAKERRMNRAKAREVFQVTGRKRVDEERAKSPRKGPRAVKDESKSGGADV